MKSGYPGGSALAKKASAWSACRKLDNKYIFLLVPKKK